MVAIFLSCAVATIYISFTPVGRIYQSRSQHFSFVLGNKRNLDLAQMQSYSIVFEGFIDT